MSRTRKPQPRNFSPPRMCGGKYIYERRVDAEQVIAEKAVTDPQITLTSYRCSAGAHWHLTRVKS